MAWHAAGIFFPTPGTPQQVSSIRQPYQSVLVQALPLNTGRIVVGSDNTVRANASTQNPTGSVLAIIGAPTSNTATPSSANGGNPTAPAAFNLQDLWVDVSNSNDGFTVSFIR